MPVALVHGVPGTHRVWPAPMARLGRPVSFPDGPHRWPLARPDAVATELEALWPPAA